MDFAVLADYRLKLKENAKKKTKLLNMKMTITPIVISALEGHFSNDKETGGLGNKRTSGDHRNYYIIENNHNTEKSPGNMKRLAVTQTSVKTIS